MSLIFAAQVLGLEAPVQRSGSGGAEMLYFFENFVLDPARRELRRGNALIAVQPQVFDLLEYLIANRDRVVSKNDILPRRLGRDAASVGVCAAASHPDQRDADCSW